MTNKIVHFMLLLVEPSAKAKARAKVGSKPPKPGDGAEQKILSSLRLIYCKEYTAFVLVIFKSLKICVRF